MKPKFNTHAPPWWLLDNPQPPAKVPQ